MHLGLAKVLGKPYPANVKIVLMKVLVLFFSGTIYKFRRGLKFLQVIYERFD